jgi:hypothetical protein
VRPKTPTVCFPPSTKVIQPFGRMNCALSSFKSKLENVNNSFADRIHVIANMPQLCVAAYSCLEGMRLPPLGHCCLSSIAYVGDSHYLDIISINAVVINAHLCSHSEHMFVNKFYGTKTNHYGWRAGLVDSAVPDTIDRFSSKVMFNVILLHRCRHGWFCQAIVIEMAESAAARLSTSPILSCSMLALLFNVGS